MKTDRPGNQIGMLVRGKLEQEAESVLRTLSVNQVFYQVCSGLTVCYTSLRRKVILLFFILTTNLRQI